MSKTIDGSMGDSAGLGRFIIYPLAPGDIASSFGQTQYPDLLERIEAAL